MLNWFDQVIRIRKQHPEIGWGNWKIIETDQPGVFAHCCAWKDKTVLTVHNLSEQACTVTLKSGSSGHLVDLFGDRTYQPSHPQSSQNPQLISLESYGYRWFRVEQKS